MHLTRRWITNALTVALAGTLACSGVEPDAEPDCSDDSCDDVAGPLWEDVTEQVLAETEEWTSKVDLADLNGDGLVDMLFANGGEYSTPQRDEDGNPVLQANRIFLNRGPGNAFEEISDVLGAPDYARVIKGVDVNADGHTDIFVGAVYQSQSRLYLNDGAGGFDEVTETNLPQVLASVGDIEFGDVDADGDLDVVLADWGPGDALRNDGGAMLLWLNDGSGVFTVSREVPEKLIGMSWDLELIDVDNDYDLDVMVSCKVCTGSSLFHNDGAGRFSNGSDQLPQFGNNYEFEMADFNGDGVLDVITINDGTPNENPLSLREHIFLGDGQGGFVDASAQLWPDDQNLGFDDNLVVILDHDSDGDPDFLIGSLFDGLDRMHNNDGTGRITVDTTVFDDPLGTPGTLGMAVADLNNDGRLDLVHSQGEGAWEERVFFGTNIPVDTAPPVISNIENPSAPSGDAVTIRARVYDNKSPLKAHDLQSVELVAFGTPSGETRTKMIWYGEYLWRAAIDLSVSRSASYQICATDAAGNEACSETLELQ